MLLAFALFSLFSAFLCVCAVIVGARAEQQAFSSYPQEKDDT